MCLAMDKRLIDDVNCVLKYTACKRVEVTASPTLIACRQFVQVVYIFVVSLLIGLTLSY
jgi:hypothetical protein